MTTQRQRTKSLQQHVEAALMKPSTALSVSFGEIARQLRIIIADDVTDDEIILAAHRVRAQWRQEGGNPARTHYLKVIEANCASWQGQ